MTTREEAGRHYPHAARVARTSGLPTPDGYVAVEAVELLTRATRSGGQIDPVDDAADVPWCHVLRRMISEPMVGSRSSRRWFVHGQRLLSEDSPVSSVFQATAAYAVAFFEDLRGREHEVSRWTMTAGIEADIDDRAGVGLAVVIRVAKLLGRWGSKERP